MGKKIKSVQKYLNEMFEAEGKTPIGYEQVQENGKNFYRFIGSKKEIPFVAGRTNAELAEELFKTLQM